MFRLQGKATFNRGQRFLTMTALAAVALAVWQPAARADQQDHASFRVDPGLWAGSPHLKVENGYAIFWSLTSGQSPNTQLEIFNRAGTELMSVNLAQMLGAAGGVTIEDVSVSPTGHVAAGVEVADKAGRTHWSLVILGPSGQLFSSTNFSKGLGILKVAVDEQEHVWALSMGAGPSDPAAAPVITKYDRDGSVSGEFLKFSQFPKDATAVHEGMAAGGDVAFGCLGDKVWLWLPSSQDFVTAGGGSAPQIVHTGLPAWAGPAAAKQLIRVQKSALLVDGSLLSEVTFLATSATGSSARDELYWWNPKTSLWTVLVLPHAAQRLDAFIGADVNELVFVRAHRDDSSFEIQWVSL